MELKQLGSSDLQISSVGLGCMMFGGMCDQEQTTAIVDASLDAGVNFFDTADIYGGAQGKSETLLGVALGNRRQDVIVATKFGAGGGGAAEKGGSREYIMQAVEVSLDRLGTDYIDLYQHHFPDAGTPVEETLRALDDLVKQGKVRYIGCSNYTGTMVQDAFNLSHNQDLASFVSAQNRYSLIVRDIEKDLVPVTGPCGTGVLPYFPLESGLLTGKYKKGQKPDANTRFGKWGGGGIFASEKNFDYLENLEQVGEEIGRSVLEMAIGWLAAQPYVSSVIAGVTKPEQIRANVAAASWTPTAEEMAKIAAVSA